MYPPEEVLRLLGGNSTRNELLRHSTSRSITASVQSGRILRVRLGHYALPDLPQGPALAIKSAGVLSHASAAQNWEFDMIDTARLAHVTVRPNAHPVRLPEVTLHKKPLGSHEVYSQTTGLWVTTPIRTVLDCAAEMPFKEALAIADSALRMGKVSSHDLQAEASVFRGRGAAKVRKIAEHASRLAANPMESALRAICIENRFGNFTPQFWIRDGETRYCLDLADEDRMIDLEADGFEHHGHRSALRYDCTRNCELTRRGWLVLRFSWEHIMLEPEWVTNVIRDTLQWRVRPRSRKH